MIIEFNYTALITVNKEFRSDRPQQVLSSGGESPKVAWPIIEQSQLHRPPSCLINEQQQRDQQPQM